MAEDARERYRSAQADFLAHCGLQAESRLLTVGTPAVPVHVLSVGTGEPLVLLHEAGGAGADWAPLAARLQGEFSLHMVDLPGHGLSGAVDYSRLDLRQYAPALLSAVLDALDLPRVTLVGNGMGAFWAMAMGMAHSDRTARLAFLGAPMGSETQMPALGRRGGWAPLLEALAAATDPAQVWQTLGLFAVAHPHGLPAGYLALAQASAVLPGRAAALRTLAANLRANRSATDNPKRFYSDFYQRARPLLFALGERDVFAPDPMLHGLGRLGGGEVVADAGHLPWLDQPERCAELLGAFAKSPAKP